MRTSGAVEDVAESRAGLGAFLDAGLQVAGLPLEAALRPRVLMHLETAVAMAALINDFPLPDEAEPAPVYQP